MRRRFAARTAVSTSSAEASLTIHWPTNGRPCGHSTLAVTSAVPQNMDKQQSRSRTSSVVLDAGMPLMRTACPSPVLLRGEPPCPAVCVSRPPRRWFCPCCACRCSADDDATEAALARGSAALLFKPRAGREATSLAGWRVSAACDDGPPAAMEAQRAPVHRHGARAITAAALWASGQASASTQAACTGV